MNSKSIVSRRQFMGQSAQATLGVAAGLSLWGTSPSWAGANDRVRIAVVGIRSQGFGSHIRSYPFLPNVEVAAICDVDENLFPERLKWFEQNKKPAPKTYVDIRKLLEDKSIDAIRANDPSIVRGNVEDGHHGCSLIHLANASYRLGRSLNFDPATQRVVNDDEANRLLTREYRKPFVVPQQV